ncbi:MAG: regulatory protein RecX [Steroidobacteraceae bacterium]
MKRPRPEAAGDPRSARAAAVALLARRDHFSAELRRKLLERGFEPAAASEALEALLAERLLDDARCLERFVAYRAERGQGPLRIALDLKTHGVPAELIGPALEAAGDWRALARTVRRRRFGAAAPADWSEKARQARFLQYRGFSSDDIRAAIGAELELD